MPLARVRRLVVPLAVAAVVLAILAPPGAAARTDCRLVGVPVSLDARQITLRGTLCRPAGGHGDTVLLALAGATFHQAYWLTPPAAGARSYMRHMTDAGYPVLALDRPGTGLSDRPPAAATTLGSEVEAVHEVVGRLRAGTVDGHAYRRVIGVGHSFGSSVLITAAARHGGLDALALTGFVHSVGPDLDALNQALVPAADDPLLGATHPPAGYLTTRAGTRAGLFLHAGGVAAGMPAVAELTKATMTAGEQATLAEAGDPAISLAVRVPVFLGVGRHDDLFCNGEFLQCTDAAAVKAWESWFYTPEARLETYVLGDAGHALNLHRDAAGLYDAILGWLASLPG